jgi:hypothetical protein
MPHLRYKSSAKVERDRTPLIFDLDHFAEVESTEFFPISFSPVTRRVLGAPDDGLCCQR